MSDAHDYATAVMRVVADGTIRVEMWSEIRRDAILRGLLSHYRAPGELLELIVDNPARANFRLVPNSERRGRVRLADYRMSSIGAPERDAIVEVNRKLEEIP